MKIKSASNVKDFLSVVNSCSGSVWLESSWGDSYNLKSELSQYLAIAELIRDKSESLELYCQFASDEAKFFRFFEDHPEIAG